LKFIFPFVETYLDAEYHPVENGGSGNFCPINSADTEYKEHLVCLYKIRKEQLPCVPLPCILVERIDFIYSENARCL